MTTCLREESTAVNAQRSEIKSLQQKKLHDLDAESAAKFGAKACDNAFCVSLTAEGLLMFAFNAFWSLCSLKDC